MMEAGSEETSRLLEPETLGRSGNPKKIKTPDPWRTIVSVAAFVLILAFSSDLGFVPQTAILQDIVCESYYAQHHIAGDPVQTGPAERCLIEPIQSEVAYINGWKDSLEILPAMLLAIPHGALADRIGRKPVLLLAVIGCFMNDAWTRIVYWFPGVFPVRLVWLGGLGQAIGAGSPTLTSVCYVLVADVAPVDQRTTAFSFIQSAAILSKVIFVPIGGALTEINPWLPMFLSTGFMILAFLVLLIFVPETLSSDSAAPDNEEGRLNEQEEVSPLLGQSGEGSETVRGSGTVTITKDTSAKAQLLEQAANLKVIFSQWIVHNPRVGLLMLCFFLVFLGEMTFNTLILQYTEKRLGWSLGQASYIVSIGAGVGLLNLLVLLPLTSNILLTRFHLHETSKDKVIAQISGVFLVIGSLLLFFAHSWVVLVAGQLISHIGYAFTLPLRSIVTSMVHKSQFGALYMGISVLTYAGGLTGNPLVARIFKWGMQVGDGDTWMGLPYLVAGGCFTLALGIASTAAVTGESLKDHGNDVEGEGEGLLVGGGGDEEPEEEYL
ncbi:Major facilitator superfamily domain containing protein [Naviculisporaceae sp. PSN 640]